MLDLASHQTNENLKFFDHWSPLDLDFTEKSHEKSNTSGINLNGPNNPWPSGGLGQSIGNWKMSIKGIAECPKLNKLVPLQLCLLVYNL